MTQPDKRPRGRPVGSKSAMSVRQAKMKKVLDQIDPLLAKALLKAEAILDQPLTSDKVAASIQLQAAKLVIDKCIDLRDEVYTKEKDQIDDVPDGEEEEQETGSVLTFELVK